MLLPRHSVHKNVSVKAEDVDGSNKSKVPLSLGKVQAQAQQVRHLSIL